MNMTKTKLVELADRLIKEGEAVARTKFDINYMTGPVTFVQPQPLHKWITGCQNLVRLLGKPAEQWQDVFSRHENKLAMVDVMQGTLQAIKESIEQDLLLTIEDFVMAEAFADLLEQAEYLLSEGYFLAAGVLGRAVLEEHLRKWCDKAGIAPAKAKPTLNDFKLELQKATKLTKVEIVHVDAMASTGNTAAHNKPGLTQPDVERLIRDVREFLVRHPAQA